ncbi:MAG: carboxypeptidase regulatory-like domain-containing protein [Bacteroidales bacterium]|nr:carboxypeptidase regulatory-like domain-containing protein [Bacteroidales bacterium]
MKQIFFLLGMVFSFFYSFSQTSANDGDWKKNYVTMSNTPEAEYMVRVGDIDNLNCGWQANFDPFSGRETDSHEYPWPPQDGNILGLDMVMLPSSYKPEQEPCGSDGYSGYYEEMIEDYSKTVHEIEIPLNLPENLSIKSVRIVMFVDDFQPREFCSKFTATIDGKDCPFIDDVLNNLSQTGPIGKIININVPAEYLNLFDKEKIVLLIDDKTTKAGDGFAIDFVKILINPTNKVNKTGNIKGIVYDEEGEPMVNATVKVGEIMTKTDSNGEFILKNMLAGIVIIEVIDKKGTMKKVSADVFEKEEKEIEIFFSE